MIKIGDRLVNINSINYIIDRHVFFNNGTSWVMTEPEIQILLAALFDEPRVPTAVQVTEEPIAVKKAIVKKTKK